MYTLGHWYPGHIKCVKALCACTFEWKLAWEHLLLLVDLSRQNKVDLMWVPGRHSIFDSETQDGLA